MQTALYFGCGADTIPLLALQETIQKFVLIESQSAFEFGSRKRHSSLFIQLRRALFAAGFSFSRQESFVHWIFVNRSTSTTVSLWMECPFPWVTPKRMREEMRQATTLICCGFFPHKSIVNLMARPVRFVTNTDTHLDTDETDIVDVRMFQVWTLIVLPSMWWSSEWTAYDCPQTLEYWSLQSMTIRHKNEMLRLRKEELTLRAGHS